MRNSILALLASALMLLGIAPRHAMAQGVKRATDVLCLAPSATGLGMVIAKKDRKGFFQLGYSSITCLAANYTMELCITKDRPDGSGHHAFPSTHTAIAFNGATFLMRRYGWKVGVPAYLVASFVAWGRVHADRHDWWDVAGGAALGVGTAMIFTRPLSKSEKRRTLPELDEQ